MSAAERREQLLDVTKEIVGEDGFHAVTIEGIARRAGITRPVVYGHFADLPTLLEAMLERESRRALSQLAAIFDPVQVAADPGKALVRAMDGYLEVVRADPVTWRLVLMPPEGAPEALRESIERDRAAVVAVLTEIVRPELTPGLGSPDPELTARLLSAIADEAARLMLTDPRRFPKERLLDQARWLVAQLTG